MKAEPIHKSIVSLFVGVTTVVVEDMQTSKPDDYVTPSIRGIQSLSNFLFEDRTVQMWKAFGIGVGDNVSMQPKSVQHAWLTAESVFDSSKSGFNIMKSEPESCLHIEPPTDVEDTAEPVAQEPTSGDTAVSDAPQCLRLFPCPEPNCRKQFNKYANLERHLILGMY